jgi:two-component system sensor histidine kinase QseC
MKPEAAPAPSRQLWHYLWAWALGAILALWLLLAGLAYYTGFHEADEISDGLLVSAAELLLQHPRAAETAVTFAPPPQATDGPTSAYAPAFHVLVWQGDRLVWDSHSLASQLPSILPLGHQTRRLTLNGRAQDWRVYVAETRPSDGLTKDLAPDPDATRRVAVLLDRERREALGSDIAEHIVSPALLFLPVMAVLLAWAIRRGLLPLQRLSSKIMALNVDAGQTLNVEQPFKELGVTVHAINHLMQRLHVQISRERRFAADVAHELRTPLTSLVLQARLARDNPSTADQALALQTVEQEAMRAGRILSQLLALARAQSLPSDKSDSVDLCALAHQVVSEHAPLAHALGQDIALEAPKAELQVLGSTTLLALALRNLVDNALRHNPPGTYVEVRVGVDTAGQPTVAVSDDGLAQTKPTQPTTGSVSSDPKSPAKASGMGIGLTLVERIAQSQGAQLVQDSGAPPFVKRYALVWRQAHKRSDAP